MPDSPRRTQPADHVFTHEQMLAVADELRTFTAPAGSELERFLQQIADAYNPVDGVHTAELMILHDAPPRAGAFRPGLEAHRRPTAAVVGSRIARRVYHQAIIS